MTRTRRLIEAARLCALAGAMLAMAVGGAAAREWTRVRIATEGANPPFNFVDPAHNRPEGFEIDVARALCERMGIVCDFVVAEWDTMIRDLRRGRFDAIVASLEITDERRARIAFSKPYYRTPAVFMVPKDSALTAVTPEAMKGLRIGAMSGTVYAAYLEDAYAGATVKLYANQEEASLDLALGRLDAVLGDKIALHEWLERGREASCCRFLADAPADRAAFGQGFAIGLRHEDEDLRARFDVALDAIMADGTYDAIRLRYFPFDVR